ncbi:recombination mediator RecR [Sulfurospirillum arcachonense]|uniref:recombination mediator RecR n=1 Tax=Sulfurospirillum arcachonense TaxID=57666 RepID=UPI000468AE78|nr:recombination mediator RecR [Sulfurospirillum arcachonense]
MKKGLEKFDNLVEALSSLPSVGKKSALRFAYHLILNDNFNAMKISNAIESAVRSIRSCERCGGLSEHEVCDICLDDRRDNSKLCITESAKDILVLEENNLYDGFYFVLNDLEENTVVKLKEIVSKGINEVIFALTPSLSNDAVILFIEDKLKDLNVDFTKIAQGVPTGVHLENVDMLSLSKAINLRTKA